MPLQRSACGGALAENHCSRSVRGLDVPCRSAPGWRRVGTPGSWRGAGRGPRPDQQVILAGAVGSVGHNIVRIGRDPPPAAAVRRVAGARSLGLRGPEMRSLRGHGRRAAGLTELPKRARREALREFPWRDFAHARLSTVTSRCIVQLPASELCPENPRSIHPICSPADSIFCPRHLSSYCAQRPRQPEGRDVSAPSAPCAPHPQAGKHAYCVEVWPGVLVLTF